MCAAELVHKNTAVLYTAGFFKFCARYNGFVKTAVQLCCLCYLYSVHTVSPAHRLYMSNATLAVIALTPINMQFFSLNGERKKWKKAFSLSALAVTVAFDPSVSPLYRSCISDAWMHKWLTWLHIRLSPSTPPFTHKTQRRFISTSFLSFFFFYLPSLCV